MHDQVNLWNTGLNRVLYHRSPHLGFDMLMCVINLCNQRLLLSKFLWQLKLFTPAPRASHNTGVLGNLI